MLAKWSEQETELGVIGRVGENNTRIIEIDCAETLEKLPGAEIICVMLRPGDETPYTLPLEANGNKRTIMLTDTDLERRGTIRLELRAVEGGAVLKSAILRGTVADSIRGEGDAPGQPVRDVLDRVDDTLKAAEATRKELETALNDIQNKLESGAFNGKDGKDAPQIDDTTVSDAAPWSSQHIVDMLCPPMTESGNPVTCYPVAGSTLGIKASWEPMQEGTGTPSQDNIRPIHGRTQVKVERYGKNLLDISQCTPAPPGSAYGLTVTVDDTGIIKLSGVPKIKNEMAVASYRALFTNQVISIENYKTKAFVTKGTVMEIRTIARDKSIIIVTPLAPDTPVDIQFRIMYYVGDVPATYTPYTCSTTSLTLPLTIYGGEVGADGTGQETWGYIESYAGEAVPAEWICDRAVYAEGATPPTGAQVAYKLATPIPFSATGSGAIKALPGVNTILTDADTLTVTGRADPIHIIQQLQAASAASAQALEDDTMEITQEEAIQEENEKGMNG